MPAAAPPSPCGSSDNGGTDNGGVDTSAPQTFLITVVPVNDPPAGSDKALTTLEDTPLAITASDFGFSDPSDSPANALQSVVITTLPAAGTLLLGTTPVLAGQEIPAAQLGSLSFVPVANASGGPYASFSFQVRDNGGTANGGVDLDPTPNTITLNVTPVNDAPMISGLDAVSPNATPASPYLQGGAAVVIDPDATLFDQELSDANDWSGATLSVTRQGGANSADVFGGAGSGGSGLVLDASNVLRVDGVVIGSYSNGAGSLLLSFNANATSALVNRALQGLTYRNAITTPGGIPSDTVTLAVTIDDQNSNTGGGGSAGSGQNQGNGGRLSATGAIDITINRLPIANADTGQVAEGLTTASVSSVSGDVTPLMSGGGNVADTDQDPADSLTVQGVAAGTPGGVLTGNVDTTVAGGFGSLNLKADGTYTYSLDNTLPAVQSLAAGQSLTDTFSYTVNDGRGGIATTTLTITVNGSNDAPVLSVTTPALVQQEDAGVPSGAVGTLVSALAGANIADLDATDPRGLAIIGADSSHGTWYYTTDGGATAWIPFTASQGAARLLLADAGTRLYFQPDPDWQGSLPAALSFRAWDGSTGSNGGTADLSVPASSTGGNTAFSSATDVANLTVTPINDRPTTTSDVVLPAISEDLAAAAATGTPLGSLAFGYSDVTDDQTANGGGTTATPFSYLAVVGSTSYTAAQGVWQISTTASPDPANSADWIDIPTSGLNTSAALIFRSDSQVRFVPAANFHGTPGSLSVRLADASAVLTPSTSSTNTFDLAAAGGTSATGAWSAVDRSISTGVSNVNDRPSAAPTSLAATTEDNPNPPGATIAALGFGYGDATDNQSAISGGADAATPLGGIAITGNAATVAEGVWQYNLNDGGGWVSIGSPSDAAALLLPASASLRFLPSAPDYSGTPGALTVRVADTPLAFSPSTDLSPQLGPTGPSPPPPPWPPPSPPSTTHPWEPTGASRSWRRAALLFLRRISASAIPTTAPPTPCRAW